MKEMCTRNELNLILQAMTQAYQAVYGANVVKIILYGSYARGDYQKDSDIDIVAIVQGDREKLQQGLKSVWDISSDLELEYGTIVSPTVIPFAEYEKYKLHHKARLSVKPGITGLWQVSGRSEITDFEEVVKLDTEYICHWSMANDIKILFRTVQVVVSGKGSM